MRPMARALPGRQFPLALIVLLAGLGASGCYAGKTTCTPADTTHSCCVKQHMEDPELCDGLEGAEAATFRISNKQKVVMAATGAGAAVAAAAVLTLEDEDPELQAELDAILLECARRADAKVNRKYLGNREPDKNYCNEEVAKDENGNPVTRAMQLGQEKHREALKCAEEELGKRLPGRFSLEQRYRYDRETGQLGLVSPSEVKQLLRQGRAKELTGTLEPDVVIHSGNPLEVQAVYDFKFSCLKNTPATWRIYQKGPYRDFTQGMIYKDAFRLEPARVTPREVSR